MQRPRTSRRPLVIAVLNALAFAAATPAVAQTVVAAAGSKDNPPVMETVTVSATKEPRKDDEIANSVSVIDDKAKEKILANDIKDLIRYEPGVSVRSNPTRFSAAGSSAGRDGNSGFNIRGIEGNGILMQTDGVRLPLAFSFGPIGYGRGDYLDLEAYKSVEILRGPASTMYGSDGLAGAVSFISKDPSDYLSKDGFYASLKGGYASVDDSGLVSLTGAMKAGAFEALIVYSQREGHETENMGENDAPNSTRTKPNPQDIEQKSLLAKGLWRPDAQNLLRLTAESFERDVVTEVLSGRAPPPLAATSVIDLDATDDLQRDRFSLDYEYENAAGAGRSWLDRAKFSLYTQESKNQQDNREDRNTAADRERNNTYKEEATGGSAALFSTLSTGSVAHRLTYGGDYVTSDVFGLRDGVTPPAGETLPSKPFPDTDYTLYGLYVQDEIHLSDAFTVIPGLRWDGYELKPRTGDPLYPTAGGQPVKSEGDEFSPKLGGIWRFGEGLSAYAQYAEGYRAPTPSQVNQGFENQIANYRSIGNPDLKPETSRTLEIGIRGRADNFTWDLVAFDGRYKDFIAQIQVSGNFSPMNPAVFQNVNLTKVRIRGAEGRARYAFGGGWAAFGNFSYAKGDDETANQPLQSIDPPRVVLGGEYQRESWGVQAVMTHAWEKEDGDIPASPTPNTSYYGSPSFTVFDLYGSWRPLKSLTLTAAVLNVGDRKYWAWSDVRGQLNGSAVLDAYTAPGRNYSLTAKVEF